MAENPGIMSNRVLSRSLSVSTIADEESRGRLLNATPQPKSPPHDLYLACINPYRAPNTVVARPLQLDFGHAIRTPSSNSVLRSSDRLRPLTPVYTKTNPSAMFATSPASLDSPSLPTIRSPSHNSLNRLQSPSTPTAKTGRGPRPSSITQSSVPQRSPRSRKSSASRPGAPHPHGKPSVKHLTCFWWKEKGDCRFREEDCLYAHHDTGLYADPPRQVIPGEPARAGRSLDRALRKLSSNHNKSSSSPKSIPSDIVHADIASRPGTPGIEPATSPAVSEQLKVIESAYAAVKSDNAFLRNLVEQNAKEKAVLVTTVEDLQVEAKVIKEENRSLKTEREHLREERDGLRAVLGQLPAPNSNPFGLIGNGPIGNGPGIPTIRRTRATNEFDLREDSFMQYIPESQNQSGQLSAMLRNLGHSF